MSAWAPPAYLFYNIIFMVALFWTIHSRDSIDGALMVWFSIYVHMYIQIVTYSCWWSCDLMVVDTSHIFYRLPSSTCLRWSLTLSLLLATSVNTVSKRETPQFWLNCYIFSVLGGWSGSFAIINFLARPFSIILLHREFNDRGGMMMSGSVFPTTQQRSYEDIDRTPNQSLPA